jgi:hypothetical protein
VASILIQEYKAMNFYLAETIAFAIGLQIIYQFWRMLIHLSRLRDIYTQTQTSDLEIANAFDLGFGAAVSGILDLSFYFLGTLLIALFIIRHSLHALPSK